MLQEFLRDEGCDAVFVGNDEDRALTMVMEMRPDIIITNGRGRIPFMRNARSVAPNTPIIVLTGGDDLEVYKQWADAVLQKPIDLPDLTTAIQVAMDYAGQANT